MVLTAPPEPTAVVERLPVAAVAVAAVASAALKVITGEVAERVVLMTYADGRVALAATR